MMHIKVKNENIQTFQRLHEHQTTLCSKSHPFVQIKRTNFTKVLRAIGFKYEKINNRAAIVQKADITRKGGVNLNTIKEKKKNRK